MNSDDRKKLGVLYRRLVWIEQRGMEGDEWEARALRWALKLIEEADALGVIPQLKASNLFSRAAWIERLEKTERLEREKRARKDNRLEALRAVNEEPDPKDAMERRVPGSFESGKRR